jgi:hypothetical protein
MAERQAWQAISATNQLAARQQALLGGSQGRQAAAAG